MTARAAWLVLPLAFATAVQEPEPGIPPARERYLGREVARTMHWRGAEWLVRETREKEERSTRMLAELELSPGDTVGDLGCGNGYHSLRMARLVGDEGRVLAVDIQPEMLAKLSVRAREAGVTNVEPILAAVHDPRLAPGSCDLVLAADVYHEVDRPAAVLRSVRAALRPGGVFALLEFRTEDPESPIKPLHRMSKAQMLNELGANGFRLAREFDGLPMQHLMFFEARPGHDEESAEEASLAQGREVAQGFGRALAAADVAQLEAFWAPRVELRAGSELLAARWGASGNRSVDEDVPRAELARRYRLLIADVGRERWTAELGPAASRERLEIEAAGEGAAREIVLRVSSREREEDLEWVLRGDAEGRWLVVSERADY